VYVGLRMLGQLGVVWDIKVRRASHKIGDGNNEKLVKVDASDTKTSQL
jgi:hypothetical protein